MAAPYRDPLRHEERELDISDESDEIFDRIAFAKRALDLVDPRRTRVLLCEGARSVHVDTGRAYGKSYERFAVLWVSRRASRRAIALAALELASADSTPYALDALLRQA